MHSLSSLSYNVLSFHTVLGFKGELHKVSKQQPRPEGGVFEILPLLLEVITELVSVSLKQETALYLSGRR